MICLMFETALWLMSTHIFSLRKNTISCANTNAAGLEHKSLLKMMDKGGYKFTIGLRFG
jgi:hypothetical protein